jgi:hypothetical protein
MKISENKWKYLSIGLMAILATGFLVPQAYAHVTTNVTHLLQHIYNFAENIETKVDSIDEKVDDVKANTDLLADPGFGLQEIKREVRDIEDRLGEIEETLDRLAPPTNAVERDELQIDAQIHLSFQDGSTEVVTLSGPLTMEVFFEGNEGDADDDDGDGLDEVPIEIVQLALTGASAQGSVEVSLFPSSGSVGFIEENINVDIGTLNVAPFSPGPARMAVEMFAIVEIDGVPLHNTNAINVQGIIGHKPPECGDELDSGPTSVPLRDAAGDETGNSINRLVLNNCVETDVLTRTAEIGLVFSDQSSEDVSLSGTLTMNVFFEGHEGVADDDDSDGLDEVEIEIVQLALAGTNTNGPVVVSLAQGMNSQGFIEEQANFNAGELDLPPFTTPGSARMLVELFVVVEVDGTLLHNNSPITVQGLIDNKPPACGDELSSGQVSVPLHDENDKVTGNSIKGLVLNRCSS